MFSGIASLSVSSALWLTAMAANPLGTEIARGFGVEIGFGRWLLAASVPTLCAMALLPLLLYWIIGPEVRTTPDAPAAAQKALAALGPLTRQEWIVLVVFVGMVALWASAATLGLDSTAIAFLGLGALLATGVHHARRHRQAGRRPGDVHLVRGALHAEQPVERAGIHGVSRPAARRARWRTWPRRPPA